MPERDFCSHMAPGKSEVSYTSQTTAYPQEDIPKQVTTHPQEYIPKQTTAYPEEPIPEAVTWEEELSNLLSNVPGIIDDTHEELVQEFLFESWV